MGKLAHLLDHKRELAVFNEVLASVVEQVVEKVDELDKFDELQSAIDKKLMAVMAACDMERPVSVISQQINKAASDIQQRIAQIKFPVIPKLDKADFSPIYDLFMQQASALDSLKALVVDLAAREYEVNIPDDRPREWEFDCKQVPSGYKITAKAK